MTKISAISCLSDRVEHPQVQEQTGQDLPQQLWLFLPSLANSGISLSKTFWNSHNRVKFIGINCSSSHKISQTHFFFQMCQRQHEGCTHQWTDPQNKLILVGKKGNARSEVWASVRKFFEPHEHENQILWQRFLILNHYFTKGKKNLKRREVSSILQWQQVPTCFGNSWQHSFQGFPSHVEFGAQIWARWAAEVHFGFFCVCVYLKHNRKHGQQSLLLIA